MSGIEKRIERMERLKEKAVDANKLYDRPREPGESQEEANDRFLKQLQMYIELGV